MYTVRDTSPETAPQRFLLASLHALVPDLAIDIGGTLGVYTLLTPHFPPGSILPLFFASLIPILNNVLSFVRHRRIDVVGIIVLIGLGAGVLTMAFGGDQRVLLLRESFMTGLSGIVLFISPIVGKPLGYYIIRHFLWTNREKHNMEFDALWESSFFQKTISFITYFWGMLLLMEFSLRVFMVLTLPVVFVLAFGPLIFNGLMIAGGAVSAVAVSRAIRVALSPALP